MKLTSHVLMVMFALLSISLYAQFDNSKTESVKVYGNCGMCEEKIEQAGNAKNVSQVSWDKDAKTATLTYDAKQTSKDEILKRIALAGYDNELYYAPDDTYEKLPACCHYPRAKQPVAAAGASDATKESHNHHAGMTAEDQKGSPLKAVIDEYLAVKDALVQSKGEAASIKAAALADALSKVKMEALEGEAHTAWMKVKDGLIEHAEHISQTKEVSHQRDHFNGLSKDLYTVVKASPTGITLYYQHCPMFDNGKGGDWLSQENAVKNPFYGSQMLTCGKTVETLK